MDYEKLLNNYPGMAFKFSLNARQQLEFFYCSAGSFALYGVTPDQLLSNPSTFATFLSPAQWLRFVESLHFCAAEHLDWQLVLTLSIQNKNRVHQFYATAEVHEGEIIYWSGFITDITQQHLAQDHHLRNERLLSSLFDLSPLGIGLVQLSSDRFIKTNSALQRLLSFTATELCRLGPELLLATDDHADFQRQKLILQHLHRFEPYETTLCSKDGHTVDVLINGMLLTDTAEPSYWILIEDISARKHFERQLIAAKNRAEVAALAKSNFLASMSHEIRTPLNGVLGMLDVLKQSQLSQKQQHQIDIAIKSGGALLQLLNNILDFSKIDAGKLDLQPINLNIEGFLQEICSPFALLAKEKQLEFRLSFSSDIRPWIRTDALRLAQVLNNLLSNALKFTHQGAIHVHASLQQQAAVAILTIEIKDSGIGISAEQTASIFDPFTQADASTTRQYGGTGLGLAICQQLSELLGGGLTVESEPDIGSTFSLWLCVELGVEDVNVRSVPEPPLHGQLHAHVLLVDDNTVNCEVVKLMLEHAGLSVDIVHDGSQAITRLTAQPASKPYDLVLMDCMMPIMDGYQATAAIRQGAAGADYRQIPVLALTANALSGDKEKCIQAGMSGYLSKPVTQRRLLAEIALMLPTVAITSSDPVDDACVAKLSPEATTSSVWWHKTAFLATLGPLAAMDVELLTAFVTSLQKQQAALQLAQLQHDVTKIQFISHSIKGSAGQVCCYPLADAAHQLHQLAKQSAWQQLAPECAAFALIVAATLAELQQFLSTHGEPNDRDAD